MKNIQMKGTTRYLITTVNYWGCLLVYYGTNGFYICTGTYPENLRGEGDSGYSGAKNDDASVKHHQGCPCSTKPWLCTKF